MKIFKYLFKNPLVITVIVILLVAQTFCELALPAYTQSIVDVGIMRGGVADEAERERYTASGADMGAIQMAFMLKAGGMMLILTLGSVATAIVISFLASRNAAKISQDLRAGIFKRILSFSGAEIDRFTTASLITRSTNDIQQIQMALVMTVYTVFRAPIMGIGGVAQVARTETGMTWIIAVAVAMVAGLVIGLMKAAMPRFKIMQTLVDQLNQVSREVLTGLPVIRAFSREREEERRFETASRDLMKNQLFTNRAMSLMMPAMMLIMNIVTILITWFGAKKIALGDLEVGGMMAFSMYAIQIMFSFMMISMVSIMLPRANVAAERVEEVLNAVPSIIDPPGVDSGSALGGIAQGVICFNDVSFRFPGAEEDVLKHISFTASPGQTTAIIGGTGSGKSTLINLIPRLYDVSDGSITLDGEDVRNMSQMRLRSAMGYVPQKGMLFTGDIASNIKFGAADISDDDMKKAAEIAQSLDFIAEKEGEWQSPIAQGGSNVSGGQKQRLSIARALAKKPFEIAVHFIYYF